MIQLTDARIIINNEDVPLMPNTFAYTEGLGEQDMKAVSAGAGTVEQLYIENIESNFGMFKFDMPVTIETIALARKWKVNKNRNVCQVVGENDEGTVSKTFTQSAMLNDYEVPIGSDTVISIEFKSNPVV